MSPENDERRPVAGTADQNVAASTPSVSRVYDKFPGLTAEQSQRLHHWFADRYSVPTDRLAYVAIVEVSDGKYRRRPYLTLAGAQAAVERAAARGCAGKVGLFELRPVSGEFE